MKMYTVRGRFSSKYMTKSVRADSDTEAVQIYAATHGLGRLYSAHRYVAELTRWRQRIKAWKECAD